MIMRNNLWELSETFVTKISQEKLYVKQLKNIENAFNEMDDPMKRNVRPEDVMGLIEYLFSDENTFITGANFPITGGEAF